MRIEREYREEAAELVRRRVPWAVGGFVLAFGVAWIFERVEHAGRDVAYAVLFGLEILVALGAWLATRDARLSADAHLRVVAVSVAAIALLVGAYHVRVDGELEILALALVFLALGSMVAFPWGTLDQLVVAGGAAASYGAALVAGVEAVTPLALNVVGVGMALGFTVLGAHLTERSHSSLLRRDAELKRTNEELERSSQLKSEFLSTMSHELRTPLNVIIGYLDLLGDGAFGTLRIEQVDPVQRAGRSARELFELITATLDLSRIDAGVFLVDLRPVPVRELVAEMATEARDLPLRPTVDVGWEVESGLESVETDRRMLKLVLRNLLGNALKFTPAGRVTLAVRRRGEGVEFAVADTGIGIPADARERIFDPFHQIVPGSGESPVGVGLGLHIVRRLVSLLGGRIEVESQLGVGSTFRVWLPRSRRPADEIHAFGRAPEDVALTSSGEGAARTTR